MWLSPGHSQWPYVETKLDAFKQLFQRKIFQLPPNHQCRNFRYAIDPSLRDDTECLDTLDGAMLEITIRVVHDYTTAMLQHLEP